MGNLGKSLYRFCIRYINGDIIFAHATSIPDTTNTEAEVEAATIREAMTFSVAEVYERCIVKTDSLLMQKIIEEEWKIPGHINTIIEDIKAFMDCCTTKIQHMYRESNSLADYMANLVLECMGKHDYKSFAELPKKRKALVNLDKAQVPNIRFNTRLITNK